MKEQHGEDEPVKDEQVSSTPQHGEAAAGESAETANTDTANAAAKDAHASDEKFGDATDVSAERENIDPNDPPAVDYGDAPAVDRTTVKATAHSEAPPEMSSGDQPAEAAPGASPDSTVTPPPFPAVTSAGMPAPEMPHTVPPGPQYAAMPPTTATPYGGQLPPGPGGPGTPLGPPPPGMGAPPPNQPRRGLGKPLAVVGLALVLVLGGGAMGGVVGFGMASGLGDHESSPSELVSDKATLKDVAAAVQPSVVSIETKSAGGSGVVYDKNGYIITNNHVAETASGGALKVAFSNGDTAEAKVVGTDPSGDMAVIKVDGVDDLTPAKFGDSDGLAVGDSVLAIGSPLGLEGSVSSGIVSALDRTIQAGDEQGGSTTTLNGLVQTDAAINPGNSGGALVNGRGELVGINTANASAGGSEGSVGVGFAIPSATVKSTVKQLIDKGGVEHAFLGVSVNDVVGDQGESGAVVTKVQKGSPADKAKIAKGDVITGIDGDKVSAASDVVSAVQGSDPGTKVKVKYTRDGSEKSASVELGSTASTD